MNKEKIWENHFNENVRPLLTDLEENRKTVSLRLKKLKVFMMFFGLFFWFPPAFIIFIILCNLYNTNKKKLGSNFKDIVIKNIINFFDENATYQPNNHIEESIIKKTLIIPHYNIFIGEDLVEMSVSSNENKTKLSFCELNLIEETTDKDGKTDSRTTFHGFFYELEFNKSFNKKLYLNSSKRKNTTLEDPAFNKLYSVYMEDQIQGRYILSTTLMESFNNLYKAVDGANKISAAFIDNKLYLAVSTKTNLFEINHNLDLLNFENMKTYYYQIENLTKVVNVLNLNQRIWD